MRRIEMEKAREILRLHDAGMTQREIAGAAGCSLGNVNTILTRAKAAGLVDLSGIRNKELSAILYPAVRKPQQQRDPVDLEWVHREMRRKGVTLTLLWEEYKTVHPNGYMLSQFCGQYRQFCKRNEVYMHKFYKAGERMLVDWAGLTMQYADTRGEAVKVYLFVADLPASGYLYTQAFRDMGQESWISANINALEYFGGAPAILVPDNTKTAVIKAGKYDPCLNKAYHEMARFYGTVIIPTRPRAPRDKAPVENGVQIVERRIIAKLRNRQFLSFAELCKAVREALEILNTQPFSKIPGNRREAFGELEKGALKPLPPSRYEYAQWKTAKAGFDYHVQFDLHYYSVPFGYAGKQVEIRATSGTIEVFSGGERIVAHLRNYDKHRRYTTCDEHMPENHKAVSGWSPERFRSWAATFGIKTEAFITALIAQREHPEQAYKTCMGILHMGKQVKAAVMEAVCDKALAQNIYTYKYFELLFKREGKDEPMLPPHENLRGPGYYCSSLVSQALDSPEALDAE
jgi:transposase